MPPIKLTPAEEKLVAKEFAKRIIDLAYMTAYDMARETMPELLKGIRSTNTNESFAFNFRVNMVAGDILQIIGRKRRKGDRRQNG
jgi:hypothetical protein